MIPNDHKSPDRNESSSASSLCRSKTDRHTSFTPEHGVEHPLSNFKQWLEIAISRKNTQNNFSDFGASTLYIGLV